MSKRRKASRLYGFLFSDKTSVSLKDPAPNVTGFDLIGKDMTLEIFKFLDTTSLVCCERINRAFHQLSQHPDLKLPAKKITLEQTILSKKYNNGIQLLSALDRRDVSLVKTLIASGVSKLDLNLALFHTIQKTIRQHYYAADRSAYHNCFAIIALLLQAGASVHFKPSIASPLSILAYTTKRAPRQCRHKLTELFKAHASIEIHETAPRLRG